MAELVGGVEVFLGKGHVVQLEILHAEEERGEVCALEETSSGAVRRNSLVVLTFCGEGVRKANPGGAKVRIHH